MNVNINLMNGRKNFVAKLQTTTENYLESSDILWVNSWPRSVQHAVWLVSHDLCQQVHLVVKETSLERWTFPWDVSRMNRKNIQITRTAIILRSTIRSHDNITKELTGGWPKTELLTSRLLVEQISAFQCKNLKNSEMMEFSADVKGNSQQFSSEDKVIN